MTHKLYRVPEEGVFRGVCAGVARYLGIPVLFIRILAVLALFCGFFVLTIIIYFAASFILDSAPADEATLHAKMPSAKQRIAAITHELDASEQRLRDLERYLTSDTYQVERRFRQL